MTPLGLSLLTALATQASPGATKIEEMNQVRKELEAIRRETMEKDAALKKDADALQKKIEDRMIKRAPELKQDIVTFKKLSAALETAILKGDGATTQQIVQKMQPLAPKISQVEAEVMKDPELVAEKKRMQGRIVDAMKKRDPKTTELLARLQSFQMRPPGR